MNSVKGSDVCYESDGTTAGIPSGNLTHQKHCEGSTANFLKSFHYEFQCFLRENLLNRIKGRKPATKCIVVTLPSIPKIKVSNLLSHIVPEINWIFFHSRVAVKVRN